MVAGQSGGVFVNTGSAALHPERVEVCPVGSVAMVPMQNIHHVIMPTMPCKDNGYDI